MAPAAPVPGLESAFTVDARLGPLEDHGVTRAGHRLSFLERSLFAAAAVRGADSVSYAAYRVT